MISEAAIEARQRKRMEPWARQLVKLVFAKLDDARSHAENAVTDTLRNTPDGRATAGRVRQSRSFLAALSRLDELWAAIGGASVQSTSGMIHDAADAFYVDSRDLWWNQIPEKFRATRREPTIQQRDYARGLLWFGLPVRSGLEQSIGSARNGLLVAAGQAGASGSTRREGVSTLKAWELRHRSALIKRAGLALNDANQRSDLQAMRDTIDPMYQES